MTAARSLLLGVALAVAVVLQVSVFPEMAWRGVVPDVVLLVAVAAGLARGPQVGMLVGFAGGVLLDLTPPADHVAGRWALALLVAGYVAGRVAQDSRTPDLTRGPDGRTPTLLVLATVAACSFLGTSVFALSGMVLRDPPMAVPDLLTVVLVALVWDLLLAPLVIPLVTRLLARLEPERATG